ncbi:MAG: type II toxin-antitoxin system VapC family toxin [Longimicrobiales bacterium]
MIVADTDVLIDALNGREPARGRIWTELGSGHLATTSISAFELRSGVKSAEAAEKVEGLLAGVSILPFDELAASRGADVRLKLEASGSRIGMADYLIAGICLAHSAALLTRNARHFERVPGLTLVRWESPSPD